MQTVQLQCGSCQNMMAISVEHLGAQVQCPHCAAVVQTPPRSALGGPPPGPDPTPPTYQPPISYEPPPAPQPPAYQPPAYQQPTYQPPVMPEPPQIKIPERESIFSEPEPVDDLFGEDDSPKIQMPEPQVAVSERAPSRAPDPVHEAVEDDEESVPTGLTEARTRLAAERKKSSVAPMLLVFLIPYAIFTTAFIAYLLVMWPSINQLEWLNDPKVVPKHDLPLPPKLKVGLNQPIQIGSMEITPLGVAAGDNTITLEFKARNLSATQTICPIEEPGFFFKPQKSGTARPFTFLEQASKEREKDTDHRIYGGDLVYLRNGKSVEDCALRPGEECIVKLVTEVTTDTVRRVGKMLEHQGKFQWRLQFRRGDEMFKGAPRPMTAVVGVEFDRKDIKGG